jgi:hypothetical protein
MGSMYRSMHPHVLLLFLQWSLVRLLFLGYLCDLLWPRCRFTVVVKWIIHGLMVDTLRPGAVLD